MNRLIFILGLLYLIDINYAFAAEQGSVKLLFVGDIMLDDGPGRSIANGQDPFRHVDTLLKSADFRIGNLECPIATTGAALGNKIFTFRAHPSVLPLLKGRFDALSVANNHAGDYGKDAFVETLNLLEQTGLRPFGGGRNLSAAHAPLWLERNGLRIALLGYNEFKPRSFEAGSNWPGIAWSEDSQVVTDIRAARQSGADLVIPFMHWGWEREPKPTARQRQLAHTMINAGADIVIGGHPHITQGAEYYQGKPIIYSLGNFVFDSFTTPATRTGWVLRLTVDRQGVTKWDTVAVMVDDDGTPAPIVGAKTPCGIRGSQHIQTCQDR
ncbi:CapA family protein [Chitinivorax sp. B]|uniref:CapA family protein n=1 Tax=Chitinivorax sp. B TaxID=2502235 RepID=UPI0010F9D76F|nr:CapA family protein [Chitinivorax sp. B]